MNFPDGASVSAIVVKICMNRAKANIKYAHGIHFFLAFFLVGASVKIKLGKTLSDFAVRKIHTNTITRPAHSIIKTLLHGTDNPNNSKL